VKKIKNKLTPTQRNKKGRQRNSTQSEKNKKKKQEIKRKINVEKVIQEESKTLHSDV
jgi:hypothetical protein